MNTRARARTRAGARAEVVGVDARARARARVGGVSMDSRARARTRAGGVSMDTRARFVGRGGGGRGRRVSWGRLVVATGQTPTPTPSRYRRHFCRRLHGLCGEVSVEG